MHRAGFPLYIDAQSGRGWGTKKNTAKKKYTAAGAVINTPGRKHSKAVRITCVAIANRGRTVVLARALALVCWRWPNVYDSYDS